MHATRLIGRKKGQGASIAIGLAPRTAQPEPLSSDYLAVAGSVNMGKITHDIPMGNALQSSDRLNEEFPRGKSWIFQLGASQDEKLPLGAPRTS